MTIIITILIMILTIVMYDYNMMIIISYLMLNAQYKNDDGNRKWVILLGTNFQFLFPILYWNDLSIVTSSNLTIVRSITMSSMTYSPKFETISNGALKGYIIIIYHSCHYHPIHRCYHQ